MRVNANNDISVYRGETAAIDFKLSQRSDYYVPFLISNARVNPKVCITIGSTRRENTNIVSKQLWLELDDIPKFANTVVTDLGTLSASSELNIASLMSVGTMYQFKREAEVAADNPQLHFAYEAVEGTALIDTYDFTVIMALDETITLDLTGTEYFYMIELMDTVSMTTHLISVLDANSHLLNKLPTAFTTAYNSNKTTAVTNPNYLPSIIALITKTFPNHWGHRITDPLTSPVARVSAIQVLQAPRRFIVESVVK